MNLWPSKKGPYDPLTYDVRRTVSVRIMLHGPWLEMRFPKRNMPLRRMHNDVEPTNVDFHEHVEVIDLSTCSIDLQPENLPTKRIWSKKYPIRIRTNSRSPFSTKEATEKMAAAKDDYQDEAERGNDSGTLADDDDELMQDARENVSGDDLDVVVEEQDQDTGKKQQQQKDETIFDEKAIIDEDEESDCKTLYLFTRTGREKEEWFNHFLVAAKFMEDWEHQNPKEGTTPDPAYETHKVKEQKFKMFMEDYKQVNNNNIPLFFSISFTSFFILT